MEFGLTWAKLDEMEYVTEAEKLGFTHLWVTDSGLIRSDAFVFLTMLLFGGEAMPTFLVRAKVYDVLKRKPAV